MRPSQLLLLAAPVFVQGQQISDIIGGITSVFGGIGSDLASGFATVTSIGGSVYTVLTSALPSEATAVGTQITSLGGSLYTVVTSAGGQLTSNLGSIGTQVTSFEGSVYTLITSAASSDLSRISAQVTSINGTLATIVVSNPLVGTKTTTASNGSVYTIATNPIGQVVSTVTPTTTSSKSSSGAANGMITQAPILAGGVLGAGMAVVALL